MKLKNNWAFLLLILAWPIIGFLQGCVYSFTGTNIDYNTTTSITVKQFPNLSGNGPADMSQVFTESLRDYYQQNTRLTVLTNDDDGDLYVEGEIVSYRTAPSTPQAAANRDGVDVASQTRLTIGVKVNFINSQNPDEDFERTFSFYVDFDSNQSLTAVENDLIDEIFDQIILDIFNATVANW